MRTVQQGDRVQVHYIKRLQDGATFWSREPLALTVGIDHPRLPGLGTVLVGMAMGQATTLTVPPELAYGLPDATRIRRWSRKRFPKEATLRVGKYLRFTDERGRRRQVRILEVQSNLVVVDTNHRGDNIMSHELKIGDRVQTTRWNRQRRYHTGDTGTVMRTVKTHDGGLPFCMVAMDKDLPTGPSVLFNTDEIEAEV